MDIKPDLKEFEECCCASCGALLVDEEATRPICERCDARLDRELAAYLEFVAVSREPADSPLTPARSYLGEPRSA